MEKMIKKFLILFLLLSITIFAQDLSQRIDNTIKQIPYASKKQTKQILHDLENLYINSVVSGEKKSIALALKGIIKCQKILQLNSSTYERELENLNPKKTIKKSFKPDNTETSKIEPIEKLEVKEIEKKVESLTIKSIKTKDKTIIIKFNHPIKSSEISSFNLKQLKLFKNIYTVKATLPFYPKKIDIDTLDNIKIKQNRKNEVRIILSNRSKIYSKSFIREGTLFIKINNNKKYNQTNTIPIAKTQPIKEESKKSTNIIPITKTQPIKKITKKLETNNQVDKVYATSKIIVIDAGHGGKDSGAIGYKKRLEKKSVLTVAQLVKKFLKAKGYKVYMTRDSDKFIKLSKRTHFANQKNADLFISIHANAAPKDKISSLKGIETFFLSPAKTKKAKRIAAKENKAASNMNTFSKNTFLSFLNRTKIIQSNKLSIDLQSAMLSTIRKKYKDVKDGGVREAPFWVLVGAQMPAALIEIGYITNPIEGDRLANPFYQKLLAKGIVNGINNYFYHNR